jgi:hypothetical protein
MIDPASDAAANSSGRPPATPPSLPPPLPPPLLSQRLSHAESKPAAQRSRGRNSAWKWILLCLLSATALGVFVTQTIITRAQAQVSVPRAGRTEPGVRHWNDRIENVPWSVHIVEIDRSRKDLDFHASIATGKVLGVSRISDMARVFPRERGKPIAIVNGDFYERDNRTYAGDPRGLQIVDGELVSGPDTAAVWFDVTGKPQLGDVRDEFAILWPGGQKTRFFLNKQRSANTAVLYTPTYGDATRVGGGRDLILEKSGAGPWLPLKANETYKAKVREISTAGNTKLAPDILVVSIGGALLSKVPEVQPGTIIELSTQLTPDLKGVRTAIAGGPAVVVNGKPFSDRERNGGGGYREGSKFERHPRSAIGWNDEKIFLITVDGRQPGLSVGMTLAEMGEYMAKKLKCTDGMNFDGGASASLWMSGSIVSDPCQGERSVANGLLVYRKTEP